jgi:DNA-directed RNA polymerase specialized sigma24 family protein
MKTNIATMQSNSTENLFELIEGCRRGDHRAQLKVYKLYYRPVLRYCMTIVRDAFVAEHIMRESFMLAFENISSYSGDASFSTYVADFIKNIYKNDNNR